MKNIIELKNNDKEESYIIKFDKNYNLDYIKYVVNNAIENDLDVKKELVYNFEVEYILNLNEIEKVYTI